MAKTLARRYQAAAVCNATYCLLVCATPSAFAAGAWDNFVNSATNSALDSAKSAINNTMQPVQQQAQQPSNQSTQQPDANKMNGEAHPPTPQVSSKTTNGLRGPISCGISYGNKIKCSDEVYQVLPATKRPGCHASKMPEGSYVTAGTHHTLCATPNRGTGCQCEGPTVWDQ
jgi:hypothetical protein